MRNAFFVLLVANLLFLGWAGWIDTPAGETASRANSHLPRLQLAAEIAAPAPAAPATEPAAPITQSAPPAPAPTPIATAAPSPGPPPLAKAGSRCVSVGPFSDLTRAARGAALLRSRGFEVQQRAEEGELWAGFWVYIAVADAKEEERVLKGLEQAGVADAHSMPDSKDGRRISVGLFSERKGAERRARSVEHLGFKPQIDEKRQPGTEYWVDMQLGKNEPAIPTEGLASLDEPSGRIEIRMCPSSGGAPSPHEAAASSAEGATRTTR